jgi:DnaJ-class molecular chaperone
LSADPYDLLGVAKTASQDDIQKAYRKLAKKLHPDLNPGNKKAEEQFKEVSAAYDILGDAEKRARFDRGEIDASGAERPHEPFYREYADRSSAHPYANDAGFADLAEDDDILSQIFGRGRRARAGNIRMRGADAHYRLALDFLGAVNGGKQQITLPDGSTLDVTIPPGTRDGQVLRLKGKGGAGVGGGGAGDALIEIEVRPHPQFTLRGDDIHLDLSVPLRDAVLGGKIRVPTPTGTVTMTLPKWSNTGAVLRLRGKGARRAGGGQGDELVTVKIVLPEQPDPALEKLIGQWEPQADPAGAAKGA